MTCPRCGNNLAPGAAFCAVCGHSLATGGNAVPRAAVEPRLSGIAIIGFVLAFVFPPAGLALSIIGRSECNRSEGRLEGGGFALAGIAISIVMMVLTLLMIVFVVAVFGAFVDLFH